ncbi:hypothetical protein SD81_003390 [Tolypothrix campylonemoides VB511288]|nr:hypothetical protein SD81_003390 [Tolypothrix campylonemoides VB511288]
MNVNKNAVYPPVIDELKKSEILFDKCKLRQVKYVNNKVKQTHRFIALPSL